MKPFSILLSVFAFSMASSAVIADGAIPPNISLPNVSPANSDLANRGAYVARTADCMACHREDYSGGVPIETPIGNIYSTNITPSQRYGIGNYTEADFNKALKKVARPTINFILPCHILLITAWSMLISAHYLPTFRLYPPLICRLKNH